MSAPVVREMFSTFAEQAVIGAALADTDALLELQAQGIAADHFAAPTHRTIWQAIARIAEAGGVVDVIVVADALAGAGRLEACGGHAYLGELHGQPLSAESACAYGRLVLDLHHQRQWDAAGRRICETMRAAGRATHQERIQEAQAIVTALGTERRPSTEHTIGEAVEKAQGRIREEHDNPGARGVGLGSKHLNHRHNGGMRPGEVGVIAGRPGMGKTLFAMNIAVHAAERGARVLVFSLEMPAADLAARMLASHGPVKLGLLKSGKVHDYPEQEQRLTTAAAALSRLPLVIDDQGGLTLADIATRARRQHRRAPLGLVVVDYLGLINSDRPAGSRNDEIAVVSRGLKALAKELDCPFLVLSQLSRKCEERGNKRPILADLRDSGAVEQDADAVLMLYRERVYNENTPVGDQVEVITAKLRNGEPGTDYLKFDGAHSRFVEVDSTMQRSAAAGYADAYQY